MPRYLWRQLTPKQREEVLAWRKKNGRPWHSPPHRPNYGHFSFLVSAACYEHAHHIGFTPQRMDSFSAALLEVFQQHAARTVAWCVLPNHYHALVQTPNILRLLYELGRLHGSTSHAWNGEEGTRGRQVFHRAIERFMRSDRHFFATVNYSSSQPCPPWLRAALDGLALEQRGRVSSNDGPRRSRAGLERIPDPRLWKEVGRSFHIGLESRL